MWAPLAGRVDLLLEDGASPMRADPGRPGWWVADVPARHGMRYAFSVDGGAALPDPRSGRQPDGVHAWSAVHDPRTHAWQDGAWRGRALEGAVLYELHIGTFTAGGTLDSAAQRLGHLVDLGVDFVQLMPVAAFDGPHGWGYDGVAWWAVHEPYGGPEALCRFVDACHASGLGVLLDVVYNHLGPSGNYLERFGPYLTDRHLTPWGAAVNLDGPGSDEVRAFIVDNALRWLSDFHLDGLRLDAVHALHDERALSLVEELSAAVDGLAQRTGTARYLIAESDRNDPRTVTPRDEGGLGCGGQWDDDVHHALHALVTGEVQGYYADFAVDPWDSVRRTLTGAFFHAGTWSSFRGRTHGRPLDPRRVPGWRFVAYTQTHDQVGNRALGDRLSASVAPGRLAVAAALVLTSPFTPMLFMGEEWSAGTPWQFFSSFPDAELGRLVTEGRRREFAAHGWHDGSEIPDPQDPRTVESSRLDWAEPGREPHRRMLAWYRSLVALARALPELRDPWLESVGVEYDRAAGWLVIRRGRLRVVCALADARGGGAPRRACCGGAAVLGPGRWCGRRGPAGTRAAGCRGSAGAGRLGARAAAAA